MAITPDRNSSHLAGEYFVAAELYRRGYSVAMTLGNAKAIDLLAEHDGRKVSVQVKAIARPKSVGWPMMQERVIPWVTYVFVCLNEPPETPNYFIATAEEARSKVKRYSTRGIIGLTTLCNEEFRDRWDKFEAALAPPFPRVETTRVRLPIMEKLRPTKQEKDAEKRAKKAQDNKAYPIGLNLGTDFDPMLETLVVRL